MSIDWRETSIDNGINSYYLDHEVLWAEIRYCRIGSDATGFGATLAGRSFLMTTDTCHHWSIGNDRICLC